jgi:hypothetical protein
MGTPPSGGASRTCAKSPESGAVQVVDADAPADDIATIDADFTTASERVKGDTGFFVVFIVIGAARSLLSTMSTMKVIKRRYVRPAKRAKPMYARM